jgi:hypothetical protein
MLRTATTIACALALAACSSPPPSQERIQSLLSGGIKLANDKLDQGLAPEASNLLHSVERVDPQFSGVSELREKLGDDADIFAVRGPLGVNRRRRVERDTNVLVRLLLWAPNRVFDLLDVVTFDVHLGLGAYANLHVTRALQAGAGFRGIFGVGAHDQRIVGLNTEADAGVVVLALGTETVSGSAFGVPGGVATGADTMAGLHKPSNEIYQTFRDYWAVGFGATAGLVGANVDLHPVQLVDFLLGVIFIDFARDDYGTTRGMHFDRLDWELMRSLHDIERSKLREAPPAGGEATGD